MKDFFTLHIRSAGGWTKELYNYFKLEYRYLSLRNPPTKADMYLCSIYYRSIFCLDLNRRGYRNIVDRQFTIWQGDPYLVKLICSKYQVYLGIRSVKKSLRKRVSVKNRDFLTAEENFDDVLTNEEEVEARGAFCNTL